MRKPLTSMALLLTSAVSTCLVFVIIPLAISLLSKASSPQDSSSSFLKMNFAHSSLSWTSFRRLVVSLLVGGISFCSLCRSPSFSFQPLPCRLFLFIVIISLAIALLSKASSSQDRTSALLKITFHSRAIHAACFRGPGFVD